ncbi:MAG: response regulator [Clostridiales bacterium]|jgi:signal transduction histidine kinase/ActR/RegA family two-component response regulator|nr:response regulator [Clostridiales bacterium]
MNGYSHSEQLSIFLVSSYIVLTVVYEIAAGQDWIWRLVVGLVSLSAVIILTRLNVKGKLERNLTAWVLPTLLMANQIFYSVIVGGDRIFFWVLLGCSFLCLSYLNRGAFLIFFSITTFSAAVIIYVFGFPVLGEHSEMSWNSVSFIAYVIMNACMYIICLFSIDRRHQNELTGQMFNTYLSMTPSGTIVINERGRVKYISNVMLELFGIDDMSFAHDIALLDLCETFELKMLFQEILESGTTVQKNCEIELKGKRYWLMVRSSPLSESKKDMSRMFEISDISPIMEAKIEAEIATKAKGDFLAHMSHEIRTPMNSIMGMMELIMLKPLDAEQLTHAISIKSASRSLLNIINDILDMSKIDSQKMEIFYEPFDLASLINDTINMISIKIPPDIALTTNISKNVPAMITGDVLRIKQVLLNLLSNSLKFTRSGNISVGVSAEIIDIGKLKMNFYVKDTGIGIKREDLNNLFGEYQQLDIQKNRNITGTGLGLSITRKFIELMGGRINIESTYGKGTNVSFYIICEHIHDGSIAPLDEPEKYNVLLYEPRGYYADASRAMFADLNVKCKIVNNEPDFKKHVKNEKYSHVFFDITAEMIVEKFALTLDVVNPTRRNRPQCTLIKNVNDMGSPYYPINFINRPLLIFNVTRILEGNVALTAEEGENEIKLGAFKVKDVRVLLVDDHPANLIVAEGMLKQYRIAVDTAGGGQEAIEKASLVNYDMIFMDHMMPEIDGVEATKQIRAIGGRLSDVIIIALSANAIIGAREMFVEAGMNDFLSKPLIINTLHKILLKYIPQEKILTE